MGMTHEGRRFLGLWVAAALIGGLLAVAVQLALLPILIAQVHFFAWSNDTISWAFQAVWVIFTLVSAVAVAGPMAFVLGRRLGRMELSWIAASAVAATIAFMIPLDSLLIAGTGKLLQAPSEPSLAVAALISGVVAGCVYGIAQAIVLRPHIRGAAWWIPASIGAWAVARVATFLVIWQISGAGTRFTSQSDYYSEAIVGALLVPVIVGVVTGLTLVRLLGESNSVLIGAAT
jgi:MFS family permease